jgi:hypothetical protein
MSYSMIALFMFSTMMLMLFTGQRVFGAIGAVAAVAALTLWGVGGSDIPFAANMKLMKWYPLLTLPMFIWATCCQSLKSPTTFTGCSTSGWAEFQAVWPSARFC